MKTTPAGRKKLLRLDARTLAVCLEGGVLAAVLIQLTLGGSPQTVLLAAIACSLGLLAFTSLGAYHLGGWLIFFYVLGNVLVALYAKTLMVQPLDSYLTSPVDAYLAVLAGTVTMMLALLMARFIKLGQPLFKQISDSGKLRFISWACFVLGGIFWFMNRLFQDPTGSGFGGVAVFQALLFMAVIARTAMLLERSGDRRSFDWKLGLILAVSVFMGLVDNQKTNAALPVASYFATVLFYRGGIPVKHAITLGAGCLVFVFFVAPMVHAHRALGEQQMNIEQRVQLLESGFVAVLRGDAFTKYRELASAQFQGGYYGYFGGGKGQMLLGRYASVQQVDPVVGSVDRMGTLGGSVIWPAFTRLLPRFLYPDKPKFNEDYLIVGHLGLINWDGGKYPTVPLVAQAYAGYGMVGLLLIPFFTFLGFLLALKKLGWNLRRNIYAIFFLCDFVIVYANQGDLSQYAGAVLRNFPLLALVFWFLTLAYALTSKLRVRYRSDISIRSSSP